MMAKDLAVSIGVLKMNNNTAFGSNKMIQWRNEKSIKYAKKTMRCSTCKYMIKNYSEEWDCSYEFFPERLVTYDCFKTICFKAERKLFGCIFWESKE